MLRPSGFPGAIRSVQPFDWNYYLLSACALALVVVGFILVVSLAI